jgi:hypothetical protein
VIGLFFCLPRTVIIRNGINRKQVHSS